MKKSTEQWKNVFVKWATERGKEKNLEAYECVALAISNDIVISVTKQYCK